MTTNRGNAGGGRGSRSGGGDQPEGALPVESQAQSVSAEAEQKETSPEQAVEQGSSDGTGENSDVQFFDGTITKIDKDGNEVMSDHLEAGEKLRRATTERYRAVKQEERREANEDENK